MLIRASTVFQTIKVPSKLQQEETSRMRARAESLRELSILSEDEEYEIRVEVYDPAVLKRHTLKVYEEDIKRCFETHPHIYTLG